jgi:hypothetical protein
MIVYLISGIFIFYISYKERIRMDYYHRLEEPKKQVETLRSRDFCKERELLYALAKKYYDEEIHHNRIIMRRPNDATEIERIRKSNEILKQLSDNAKIQNYRYSDLLTFSLPEERKEIINDILDCLESIEEKLMELVDSKSKSLVKVKKERGKIGVSLKILLPFTKNWLGKGRNETKNEVLKRKQKYSNYTLEALKLRYDAFEKDRYKSILKTKKRSTPRTSVSPSGVSISLSGGATSGKKVVCGKLRCIYKIHGSRKEHLKYKGRLITVAEYKKIMMKN